MNTKAESETEFSGVRVMQIFRLLEDHGVPVWLDGGWGIDALVKRQTRQHRDLDLIIPAEYLSAAEIALAELEFSINKDKTVLPVRLVLQSTEGFQVDIHPVDLKPNGSAEHLYFDEDTRELVPFVHSAVGLSGVGIIGGRIVRCTTPIEQIRQRTDRRYSPWSKARIGQGGISADLEDVTSLQREFGSHETFGERRPDNLVNSAAEQFCLRHITELNLAYSTALNQKDQLRSQYDGLRSQHEELRREHEDLRAEYVYLKSYLGKLRNQIQLIHGSTSWRLTEPMRLVAKHVRRAAGLLWS